MSQPAAQEAHAEAPAAQLPPIALTLPADSGLEMVETKHHSLAEPEDAEPPRARRVRPPRVAISEEPLQMVETRQDSPPPAP